MSGDWRDEPASEKQKLKLHFFGCSWDEGITKGQASDALDECARQFPDKNEEYYSRPATDEQLAKLREYLRSDAEEAGDYGDEGQMLTYRQAKELLEEYQLSDRVEAQEKANAYVASDKFKIDNELILINFDYADEYREVTREEVTRAWELVKSRQTEVPETSNLLDALEELFIDFKPRGQDSSRYVCQKCGRKFKIRHPQVTIFPIPLSIQIPKEDVIAVAIKCPNCQSDVEVLSLNLSIYGCPRCLKEYSAPKSQAGQILNCTNCREGFRAVAKRPDLQKPKVIPLPTPEPEAGRLPDTVGERKQIIEKRLSELNADGVCTKENERELMCLAVQLGFKESFVEELLKQKFTEEFRPIQQRAEKAFVLTDEDLETIERLKKKYAIELTLEGDAALFRSIFLIEFKKQLPEPISTNLMLGKDEVAFYSIATKWYQLRVNLKEIASGILYVTSDRLLFVGTENTSINLKSILDGQVFADSLKIVKSTGKPNFFSMTAVEARYIVALIRRLK